MEEVYGNLITYYQWTNFGKPWYEDYAAQNAGRLPFVSPSPLVRWQYGANNVSEDLFNDGLAKKAYYKKFIINDVLVKDNATCSSAIYVEPENTGTTSYRVRDPSPTSCPADLSEHLQIRAQCPIRIWVRCTDVGCASASHPHRPSPV